MKNFKVTVNGKTYEVEVEEIGNTAAPPTTKRQAPASSATPPRPVAATPAPKAEIKAAAPENTAADGSGTTITSPMPGNILSVNVQEGDSITKGQVLLILEAMKMENEIMAAGDGKVISVNATKGTSVSAGDTLLVLQFN